MREVRKLEPTCISSQALVKVPETVGGVLTITLLTTAGLAGCVYGIGDVMDDVGRSPASMRTILTTS